MVNLDKFKEEASSGQKQTHITYPNPDHNDSRGDYAEVDVMRRHYNAALFLKNSAINRKVIVGEFMCAIEQAQKTGSEEPIEEFFEGLMSQSEE